MADMFDQEDHPAGHRERLRKRFLSDPASLSDTDRLELLLTYAIPRRDVAAPAQALIEKLESLEHVLGASVRELMAVPGIGEQAAILIRLVGECSARQPEPIISRPPPHQPALIAVEPALGPLFERKREPPMRVFANDEIANSLEFVPRAAQFPSFAAFKDHLRAHLPYNSDTTRERRANYILGRFFPDERLDVPLAYFAAQCSSPSDLKPALFYHLVKAEPLVARVAEELVWPALPVGRLDRDTVREFILRHLPDSRPASQAKMLSALFTTYDQLSVGQVEGTQLHFRVHPGTLEGFLYVLTCEFPEPGMYSFDRLERGPMRRWLLWDGVWMREQLYNLRDLGILTKVSEIDTVRQFTLTLDQWSALRHYFQNPARQTLAMREQPPS